MNRSEARKLVWQDPEKRAKYSVGLKSGWKHRSRKRRPKFLVECWCKCGALIIGKLGKDIQYINGHNFKVHKKDQRGEKNHMYGKNHSKETLKKMSKSQSDSFTGEKKLNYSTMMKELWKNPEERKKRSGKKKYYPKHRHGHTTSVETRNRIGLSNKGKVRSLDFRMHLSKVTKGKKLSPEVYQKRIEKIVDGYSNNCKTYHYYSEKNKKQIYYHSKYELACFELLEKMKIVKSYERCKYVVDYEYEGSTHKYIPDIVITYDDGRREIIEIKPEYQLKYDRNIAKIDAAQNYFGKLDIPFSIWTETKLFN